MSNEKGDSRLAAACLIGVVFVVAACAVRSTVDSSSVEPPAPSDAEIRTYGALRAMFHEGRVGPEANLGDLLPDGNLYAVGALAELSGEVTIVSGRAYLSYSEGDGSRTEALRESDEAATLLVTAGVSAWRSVTTETAVAFEDLDDAIAQLAESAGLSAEGRFPFMIEGVVEDLHWHVIDGRRLVEGGDSHEDHLAASVTDSRDRTRATLIGFYSTRDQGVFTHMGSRTHVHSVVENPLAAGHVDHVVLPAGTVVKFPAAPRWATMP